MKMPVWRSEHPGVEEMKVAVMGCVVNGPGESKHANIGISLPGTFEEPKAPVYVDGRLLVTLRGDDIVAEFLGIWRSTSRPNTASGPRSGSDRSRGNSPRSAAGCKSRPVRRRPGHQSYSLRVPDDSDYRRHPGRGGCKRTLARAHSRAHAGVRSGLGTGVLGARTAGWSLRHPLRQRQLESLGSPDHGQPAPRVWPGTIGRLYPWACPLELRRGPAGLAGIR